MRLLFCLLLCSMLLSDAKAQTSNKSRGAAVAPPETTGTSPDFEIRPGDSIVVKIANAPLVVGSSIVGCVTYGQQLEVQSVQADWCWVKSLKCEGRIEGWINRRNVDKVPTSADEQPKMAKESQAAAVAAIEKLGGRVTSDEKNPGKPVTGLDHRGTDHRGTKVTDAGLVHLAGLTSLQTLNLGSTQVTDVGLGHLKGLTSLKMLALHSTEVTDGGLEHLKGLTSLQSLYLNNTQVTDAGLVHLMGLTSLKTLELGSTQVTDVGLEHLKGLTSLRALYLYDTKVTDAGLVHLKGLRSLQLLQVRRTDVSNIGVVEISSALPECRCIISSFGSNGEIQGM